jgi:HigB_toxin, RelE-like toxic component of a toxin-antitoxin system
VQEGDSGVWEKYSDAVASLAEWQRVVMAAKWDTPVDVKAAFRNADFVVSKTVFNIALNRLPSDRLYCVSDPRRLYQGNPHPQGIRQGDLET